MKYTLDFLFNLTTGYDSISSFKENHSNVYVAICRKGLREEFLGHMEGFSDTAKLSKAEVKRIAKKYKILKDFRENEPKAVGRAKYFKIHKKVTSHMIRTTNKKWDKKTLTKEAKKYKTVKDFRIKSKSAYTTMMRLDLKYSVAAHLI